MVSGNVSDEQRILGLTAGCLAGVERTFEGKLEFYCRCHRLEELVDFG